MSTQSAHLADKLQQGERLLSRQLECTVNSAHSTLQLGRAYFYFPLNSGEVLPATREDCNTYTLCANNENSLLLAGIAVFKLEPINGKCLHEIYAAVAFDTGAEHNEPPQLCARFIVTERGVDFSCSPERLRHYYERSISHALRPMQSPQLIQGKSFDATFALECWMDRSSSTRPFELRVSLLPSNERSSGNILDMEYLELPYPGEGRGGEGQPMSVRSSTIDVDAFADEDECDDDFAYDNRMMDHFSQHMESMHLATGLDSQHAELTREHQNESYTSGSTGTCVSMTIANNHPLVALTGRHQYTHEGTIEMEPTDSINHEKTQEYRATNRGAKDTAAVVVYEVKSTHHLASAPSRPYHRLFLAVACRNKIEKQGSASTKYTAESSEERADMANIHETCVFLFRSDSPNFPEYDLLLKRFYEHYAVHLLAPMSDDDTTSWMYLLDNDTSFVVQFSQIQNGNSATTRVSIEETSKEYTDNNNNNNNRSVSSFPNQILMLGPVLDIPLSGFSWHCSNAFIEIAKEIEVTMSWKPSQAIQLIENATDRLDLTIVPIWSSDHFELLSNDTHSSKPIPQHMYEICRVNTTNSPVNKCLAIYHLSNVSTTASLMDDPLDGTIMIVHHHNYLTALTVISVNNIQRDQLISHVVPSLENKGIVNYFGSMIPAYRYISLDESTRMCIKAFRAHPESNDKEHITKPAVITVSVIDQPHEEYSKAEVNMSVVNNSIQPRFRIHHDIEHEGFSLELPSEWCIGYTREKSNEESNNTSILLEDADIIQHVRNTTDSMEEGIIAMEYLLLHDDDTPSADNKISLFTRVYSQGSSGIIIDVNMQWQQGKHLVMNDSASINTSYTLDNNVDRHMIVQGYTPSNDRCLLSMYLVEIPSTKSYDILFLATNSLVEMRGIMRAALSKIDMVDHLFDEPLYMSIDENDSTNVEHTTTDDDDDVISNNIAVELIEGTMFLGGNTISYADDIDLSSKYLADIPIYNSKQGCVVWEIHLSDINTEYGIEHMQHYLGLYWKYTKSTDGQLVKNIAVYAFISDQIITPDKTQFTDIMEYMESASLPTNNNKYMYTLPTGECFGISIDMPDDPTAKIGVRLYQKGYLARNDNARRFSKLESMILNLSKHPCGFTSKSARH